MEFQIRPLTDEDYDNILLNWWKDWKWTAPIKDFLPDNGKGGIIVFDGETPICAGFLYATNSKVAWIDWIISSKTYRKKPERQNAIGLLIETLTNIAKQTGHSFGYALIKHQGLIETYQKIGYVSSGQYNTEMIKTL
jgi:hypothetical protein